MKTLELQEMEQIEGGACLSQWIGFGVLVAVGVVAVAAVVSTGGAAAVLMASVGGKLTAGALTVGGLGLIGAGCD